MENLHDTLQVVDDENNIFQEMPVVDLADKDQVADEVVEGELTDDAIESYDLVEGEIVPKKRINPAEIAQKAIEDLHKAREEAGIEPIPQKKGEERTPEAQAELDNWESLSITMPRETREQIMAKAHEIKDQGMRRRTERYAEANWLYEQSDKLNHQAEKAQAHGNNITAAKLFTRAKELYARGTEEYTLADREYDAYLENQKSTPVEKPAPTKKGFFSKIGGWFKKSK